MRSSPDGQSLLDVVNVCMPGAPPPPPFLGAHFAAFFEVNGKDREWVANKLTPQPEADVSP